MRLIRIIVTVLVVILFLSPLSGADNGNQFNSRVAEHIQKRMAKYTKADMFTCHGEMVCGISLIPLFYERRDYKPAWRTPSGTLFKAEALMQALSETRMEGLRPSGYHLSAIGALVKRLAGEEESRRNPDASADLDILMTDAFLFYASHLISGRVNPETIHSSWEAFSPRVDLIAVLENALESGDIEAPLQALAPRHDGYVRLRSSLGAYRRIAESGGWPTVPGGKTLKPGMTDPRTTILRQRLVLSEDMTDVQHRQSHVYDDELAAGVRNFQKRHGLEEDGIVGRKTLAALNISIAERIRQIEINMERWRWIPRDLGKRHILVNIADFSLKLVEDGKTTLAMRVIAGKPYRKTPVFSGKMKFLVVNPYWNIPHSIAVKDILPKACSDSDYLRKKQIRVFENWEADSAEFAPGNIDWCRINPRAFSYRFRQDPGPGNSLGRIKFIFPNPYSVYLHDTPDRGLFERVSRDFSSGCIRVERPVELAALLLKGRDGWTKDALVEAIALESRRVISLKEDVFVHLLYLTAWADAARNIHFADDIYGRDHALIDALAEKPPREFE